MTKYLCVFKAIPEAPWPTDPVEYEKVMENIWASIDDLLKKGVIKEVGAFLDGTSGYGIAEAEGATIYQINNSLSTYFSVKVNEIIPYEQSKEAMRQVLKAQIEAEKK